MTIFTWGNNEATAPIQKLEVVPYGGKKDLEAVIYAAPGAQQGDLAKVPDMLRSIGMTVIPDTKDDQFVLRVRGFGANESLIPDALEQNGFANAAARQSEPSAKKKRGNPVEALKEQSLKAAGLVYFVGDAALMIAGMKHKDMNELRTGAAFTLGSIGLARYAKKKPNKAFNELYDKMLTEFSKDGVEVPDLERVTNADLGKKGGLIERIETFLYDHPSEVFTGMNAYAGYQMFKAGRNQDNLPKSIAGTLIGTGMLVALLVPEKKKEAEGPKLDTDTTQAWVEPKVEEKKGLFAPVRKFADWVQEKPLRVGGYMAIANNVAQATGAITEKRRIDGQMLNRDTLMADKQAERQAFVDGASLSVGTVQSSLDQLKKIDGEIKHLEELPNHVDDWKYNMAAAASYFVANSLLSISSKDSGGGHGGGGKSNADPLADVEAASAAILAGLPDAEREPMIQRMALTLSEQKEVSQTADEIATKMREKVELAKASPWLARVAQQQAAIGPDATLVR